MRLEVGGRRQEAGRLEVGGWRLEGRGYGFRSGLRPFASNLEPLSSGLSPQTSFSLTAGFESGGHALRKGAEIAEVVPANVEYDLPVDVLVTMHGDITEPHGFGQARG